MPWGSLEATSVCHPVLATRRCFALGNCDWACRGLGIYNLESMAIAVQSSPDGRKLMIGSQDGTVCLKDLIDVFLVLSWED